MTPATLEVLRRTLPSLNELVGALRKEPGQDVRSRGTTESDLLIAVWEAAVTIDRILRRSTEQEKR